MATRGGTQGCSNRRSREQRLQKNMQTSGGTRKTVQTNDDSSRCLRRHGKFRGLCVKSEKNKHSTPMVGREEEFLLVYKSRFAIKSRARTEGEGGGTKREKHKSHEIHMRF